MRNFSLCTIISLVIVSCLVLPKTENSSDKRCKLVTKSWTFQVHEFGNQSNCDADCSEFVRSMENWFELGFHNDHWDYYYENKHSMNFDRDFHLPYGLHLGGTPLDHSIVCMRDYLKDFKREYNLISKTRLSHIWHMTLEKDDKPLIITDGALNVNPNVKTKMHILRNAIDFCHRINIPRPKISILSATEEVLDSMQSSIDAKEITELAKKESFNADIFGPLAFDNSISKKSAGIKGIKNEVAGDADVLLVPNVETGNALVKMMIYFMGACAAGVVVGGKVPVVITSRSDDATARLASIAASVVALD